MFTVEKKSTSSKRSTCKTEEFWPSSSTLKIPCSLSRFMPQLPLEERLFFVPNVDKFSPLLRYGDSERVSVISWTNRTIQNWHLETTINSASSHGFPYSQICFQCYIPVFIAKAGWPARNPNFNPLHLYNWFILKVKVWGLSTNQGKLWN